MSRFYNPFKLLKKISYKKKIIIFSIFISIVPLLLLGIVATRITVTSVQNQVDKGHQAYLKQIDYQLNTLVKNIDELTFELASHHLILKSVSDGLSNISSNDAIETIKTINQYQTYADITLDISVIYEDYDKFYSTESGYLNLSEFVYNDLNEIVTTKFSGSTIVSPFTYPNQDELLFVRPVPTFGKRDGLVVVHIDTERLENSLNQISGNYNGRLIVVDEKKQVILSNNNKDIGTRLNSSTNLYQLLSNPKTFDEEFSFDGINYTPTVLKTDFNNWNIVAMTPENELTEEVDKIIMFTWVLIGIISIIWVIFIFKASDRLYSPLKRIMTNLDYNPKQHDDKTDEFTSLQLFLNENVNTNKQLKNKLDEQNLFIKETVHRQLLLGNLKNEEINHNLEHISIEGPWFYVCVVEIDQIERFKKIYDENERTLMMYALSKMINEIFEPDFSAITVKTQPEQVALIIETQEPNEQTFDNIIKLSDLIREKVLEYLHFSISIAISDARIEYISLKDCYQHALTLLNYRFTMGENITITDKDTNSSKGRNNDLVKLEKLVISNIFQGDLDAAEQYLTEMTEAISENRYTYEIVLGIFAYLIGEIHLFIHEMGYDKSDFFTDDLYEQLHAKNNVDEVKDWLIKDIFQSISKSLSYSKQEQTIKSVINFIHENLETDISLQFLSDEFDMSTSELSKAFKAETGMNFSNYMIEARMNKAKEWLIHSNKPIKEVAERLCYTNVHNFTRVFKKIEGLPPGQFRKKYR